MKNYKAVALFSIILIILTACSHNADRIYEDEAIYDETEIIYEDEAVFDVNETIYEDEVLFDENEIICDGDYGRYEVVPTLPLDEFAAYYFTQLQAIWDDDDGEMWGVRFDSPVIIFCPETHMAAANRADAEGEFEKHYINGTTVYMGIRQFDFMGYGRASWGDQIGVFVCVQDMQSGRLGARGVYDRSLWNLMLINHNILHSMQHHLMGVYGASPPHINDEQRVSIESEINALVYAVTANGDDKIIAINEALAIRHARRETFRSSGCVAAENRMKLSEGMAVYAELHMVFDRSEIEVIIQTWPEMFAQFSTFSVALGYGYYAGALYGMLLDDFGIEWRSRLTASTDLGLMLQIHLE